MLIGLICTLCEGLRPRRYAMRTMASLFNVIFGGALTPQVVREVERTPPSNSPDGQAQITVLRALLVCALAVAVVAHARADMQAVGSGQSFRDCSDCPEMVVVPAGSFIMGSSDADTARDMESVPSEERSFARISMAQEHPDHPVTTSKAFALGKYPVTRAQFAAFVRDIGHVTANQGCTVSLNHYYANPPGAGWQSPGFSQTDQDPVVCVSWGDAQAYVAWLNANLRKQKTKIVTAESDGPYRLPSEAEWEYAARAGSRQARWWGDAIGSGNAVCDGCGSKWDNKQPSPVGSFLPNPFGLYDVLGNVWQWTEDCWNQTYQGAPADGSAWMTGSCTRHVARGGDWSNRPWVLRSADRTRFDFDKRANYVGFRVAKTLE